MSDRPILFNGDMVLAILVSSKTQTRRPVKPQPEGGEFNYINPGLYYPTKIDRHGIEYPGPEQYGFANEEFCWPSPFGKPGDRLWVRESAEVTEWNPDTRIIVVEYLVDGFYGEFLYPSRMKWVPKVGHRLPNGIFKDAARISLMVKNVRVERVRDISERDAQAEGFTGNNLSRHDTSLPSKEFRFVWDSIYAGKGLGWEANPWVWVCEFERIDND